MTRLKPPVFRLESLEDRSVPAVFGEPWMDGRHLTLSFAGDGTLISGVGSSLTTTLGSLGLDNAKLEILRAFQSWVANANVNIGLVADSNWAFATPGALQGDPRFGDIRIGARTLAGDVLAITAPPTILSPSSGDLILNAGKLFAFGNFPGKVDLFTVAMQESGHTFGLGNSIDPSSVMFEQYGSARAGLSAGDVAELRALYGARTKDAFEGTDGNDTLETATTFTGTVEGDLTNTTDADVYRYTAEDAGGRWFRVKASGLSLVSARLEVLDAAGQVVGSAAAAGPLQNDVSVYVDQLVPGATYYLRVTAARSDVFGVGAYRLVVDATVNGTPAADPYALVDVESATNDTVATATTAAPSAGPYDFAFRSSLSTSADVDFFRVRAPDTTTSHLNITVSGVGLNWFAPQVDVYSTAGVRLAAKVVLQTNSSVSLSLDGVAPGAEYIVRVASNNGSTGNYDAVADFRMSAGPKMMGATGTLSAGHTLTSATLTVWQSQTVQINMLASQQSGTNTIGLVRIYDSQNRLVFELYSQSGVASTGHAFLRRGLYRVEVQTIDGTPVDFSMTMWGVSDPIGATPTDPTGTPDGSGDILPPPPNGDTTVAITPPPLPVPTVTWF